jgi:hypothetical protein
MGTGSTSTSQFLPTNVTSNQFDVLSISTNLGCGIISAKLFCWGTDGNGQLGRNTTTPASPTSPSEVAGGGQWTDIFANYYHACGIQVGGVLYCWVRNSRDAVGRL